MSAASGASSTHAGPHKMYGAEDPEGPLSCECECLSCWHGGFDGHCLCLACEDEAHDHTRRPSQSGDEGTS